MVSLACYVFVLPSHQDIGDTSYFMHTRFTYGITDVKTLFEKNSLANQLSSLVKKFFYPIRRHLWERTARYFLSRLQNFLLPWLKEILPLESSVNEHYSLGYSMSERFNEWSRVSYPEHYYWTHFPYFNNFVNEALERENLSTNK